MVVMSPLALLAYRSVGEAVTAAVVSWVAATVVFSCKRPLDSLRGKITGETDPRAPTSPSAA
jgi:hypothetical protein